MAVAEYSTQYYGSAVKFCPNDEGVFLVATSQNLIGVSGPTPYRSIRKGRLFLLSHNPANNPAITKTRSFDTPSSLLDCSWSRNATHAATSDASGDVMIFNAHRDDGHIRTFTEYSDDVRSIDWNPSDDHLLAASIGGPVMVWDVNANSLNTVCTYENACRAVQWNPVNHKLFATLSSSGPNMAQVFDLKKPERTLYSAIFSFPHPEFVVSCGWSGEHILGTTSLDKRVRLWDTRKINNDPMIVSYDLEGSSERSRVRFAPGYESSFVTCSKTGVSIWGHQREPARVGIFNQPHDHFDAVGVDVSPSGLMATVWLCGKVSVWRRNDWPLPLQHDL